MAIKLHLEALNQDLNRTLFTDIQGFRPVMGGCKYVANRSTVSLYRRFRMRFLGCHKTAPRATVKGVAGMVELLSSWARCVDDGASNIRKLSVRRPTMVTIWATGIQPAPVQVPWRGQINAGRCPATSCFAGHTGNGFVRLRRNATDPDRGTLTCCAAPASKDQKPPDLRTFSGRVRPMGGTSSYVSGSPQGAAMRTVTVLWQPKD